MKVEIRHSYSFHQLGKRQNQEDNRFPDRDSIDGDQRFFVVCDGVGGNSHGELASEVVCDAIGRKLAGYELDEVFDDSDLSDVLNHAYDALDEIANRQNADMGTTLTLAVFDSCGAVLAHIGDSRIYQLRPGTGIMYRSEDHSLVNEMVKAEIITAETAAHHPQRHVISRAMSPSSAGRGRCAATVAHVADIMEGDVFLLCSDGVTDLLTDTELAEQLLQRVPLRDRVSQLARVCADSDDNNTCIAVEIGSTRSGGKSQTTISQVTPESSHAHSWWEKILIALNFKKQEQ
ncbi:MAG: serine/threonine-protein phosphatase [Prevotella sp.]|nr:serine/threonine-protein phosphatase [Prevotella sp.]